MLRVADYLRCFVDRNSVHPAIRHKSVDTVGRLHDLARMEKNRYLCEKFGVLRSAHSWRRGMQELGWAIFSFFNAFHQFFLPECCANRRAWHAFVDIPRMFWIALRYNLSAVHFYLYELHRTPLDSDHMQRFLTGWESHFLARYFSRVRGHDVGALDNKVRFALFCLKHDLPTIPLLDLRDAGVRSHLEPRDLFVKGSLGSSGKECMVLRHDPAHQCWTLPSGQSCRAEGLAATLDAYFRCDRYVVQYRVQNHPRIQWLSDSVLTTIRAVTAWKANGEPGLLRCTIRLPSDSEAFLDNTNQGGLAAPVDPQRGIIEGPAIAFNEAYSTEFPLGQARSLIGFELPLWDDVKRCLHRAHRAAGNYNFLGWDVALTTDGVALVECNVWSDTELVQVPQRQPLLAGEWLDCLQVELGLCEALQARATHLASARLSGRLPEPL